MPVKTLTSYKSWKPVFHTVLKNTKLAEVIHEKGYVVVPFLNENQLSEIKTFYQKEHSLAPENGGMFYSLYSKNLDYRKKVHETIGKVLKPLLDIHFTNYKNIVNTFITKASGPESEFYLHQDTTALDEFKHSPLSVWIPLQDITPENGALGVIEKTHWFFSPYRGISFPSPFHKINSELRSYLKPIYLKAGEAIIFDSRMVHHSMPNVSGNNRLVALCGIFPKEAEFITCFADPKSTDCIELLKHDDSFILENESFFYDCHTRPKGGIKIGEVKNDFPEMNSETFEELCLLNNIKKERIIDQKENVHCQFIAEPDGVNITSPASEKEVGVKLMWRKFQKKFS